MTDTSKRGWFAGLFGRSTPSSETPRKDPPVRTQVRRYKAARPGGLARGFGSGLLATSPRAEVRQDIRGLVSHSRFAAQNFDHIKSFEMMVRRHVVGPNGIALQVLGRNSRDGKLDRDGNKIVQDAFKEWCKRGNCTPCGRLSFWQVEKVAATMLAREGNFFLREWRGRRFGPFMYQIQPLSIDLLDTDYTETLSNGSYVDGGIEFNNLDKPLAFHFFDGHPAEPHTGGQRRRLRIPADEIIHVVRHDDTAQALGVPESHTALRRFNMLHQYEEAALQAAHYGAASMVFLEQTDPEGYTPPDGVDPEDGGPIQRDEDEEIPAEIEAGLIATLPPGYKAVGNPSNYPDANMPGFLKAMARGGAAGLGVSYAGLSSDMEGASFSSLKDGRGEERDEWRMFQRDLAEGLHGEVYKSWLAMAFLANKLAPLPATKFDKFSNVAWRGRGWVSVNPKDDATANDKNLANRLTTPSDIVANQGQDFGDLVDRFEADLELLAGAKIPLSASLQGVIPQPDLEPPTADPDTGKPLDAS